MAYESISCYTGADVQALQARSDEHLHVSLVSLESVRAARESYVLLRHIVPLRNWLCAEMDRLALVASVALELVKVEDDLFPRLLVEGAKLEGGVLEALLLLKNSATTLLQLGEDLKESFKEEVKESIEDDDDDDDDDGISGQVHTVGVALKDTAAQVLAGHNIVWLQARVTRVVQLISAVLATPVRFRQEEKVAPGSGLVLCYNSADIRALHARSHDRVNVCLVSLESVRAASESHDLLHQMLAPFVCPNMDLLSLLAGVALELHKVEHDLFPRVLVQGAKLEGGVMEALLLLKNSAFALIQLGKAVKEKFKEKDRSFDDGISGPVRIVGEYLMDIADRLILSDNIVLLQERVRRLVQPIQDVLATPVRFP